MIMTTTMSDPGLEKGGDGGEGGKCRNNKPCTQWDYDHIFCLLFSFNVIVSVIMIIMIDHCVLQ